MPREEIIPSVTLWYVLLCVCSFWLADAHGCNTGNVTADVILGLGCTIGHILQNPKTCGSSSCFEMNGSPCSIPGGFAWKLFRDGEKKFLSKCFKFEKRYKLQSLTIVILTQIVFPQYLLTIDFKSNPCDNPDLHEESRSKSASFFLFLHMKAWLSTVCSDDLLWLKNRKPKIKHWRIGDED